MKYEERKEKDNEKVSNIKERIHDFEEVDCEKARSRLLKLGPGWSSFTENFSNEEMQEANKAHKKKLNKFRS